MAKAVHGRTRVRFEDDSIRILDSRSIAREASAETVNPGAEAFFPGDSETADHVQSQSLVGVAIVSMRTDNLYEVVVSRVATSRSASCVQEWRCIA